MKNIKFKIILVLLTAIITGNISAQSFTFKTQWGGYGVGFQGPYGVCLDSAGNVYVTDYGNSRIQKFTSSGAFITSWFVMGSDPFDIKTDASGKVYTLINDWVQIYSTGGTFLSAFGTTGSGPGQFDFPMGIAVDNSGNIYVTEVNNYRVQSFTSSGTFITAWGSHGSGNGQFSMPRGIAVSNSGKV